ncbi:phosphodiester glycosidase family protein [Deinococcus multiflagellatus]|uniref:Phosphodiester glycosidase family protein n=1 Tax=Deinococcus multiflagellatus TaxID=1656887 RepID=A0ABW1ZLZ0_9DEIO
MKRPLVWLGLGLSASVAQGLSIDTVSSGGSAYTVATVDLQRDRLELHWQNPTTRAPYTTFEQLRARLAKEGRTLLFATNSGIYAPGLKPLGLHIEQGRTLVPLNRAQRGGNFALVPNGVFWVAGQRAGVSETGVFARSGVRPTFATQSGPLLVQGAACTRPFANRARHSRCAAGLGCVRTAGYAL